MTADTYSTQPYTRTTVARLRCGFQERLPFGSPREIRAYYRRMIALLDSIVPDFDPAKDCKPAEPPPLKAKRFSMPAPLPDEGAVEPSIEQVIETIHDQLDSERMTRAQARDMYCELFRQTEQARAEDRLHRSTRGMYRRLGILFEAYHPGSTKTRCQ